MQQINLFNSRKESSLEPLELGQKKRKICTQIYNFDKLPADLWKLIFNHLYCNEFLSLALVSKRLLHVTSTAPFWQQLCHQAGFTEQPEIPRNFFLEAMQKNNKCALLTMAKFFVHQKNIATKQNIHRVTLLCKEIQQDALLSENEASDITCLLRFLDGVHTYMHYPAPVYTDKEIIKSFKRITDCNINVLLIRMKMINIGMKIEERYKTFANKDYAWLLNVSTDETLSDWIRLEAKFHIALASTIFTQYLEESQAYDLLVEIHQNQAAPLWIKMIAKLEIAQMRIMNIVPQNDTMQSFELLQTVSLCDAVNPAIRTKACYYMAYMRFLEQTEQIDDEQAFKLFQTVSQAQNIEHDFLTRARYFMAIMRCDNRTKQMDDESAFKTLQTIRQNPNIPSWMQVKAGYYIAIMRCEDRTKQIDDESAFKLLQTCNSTQSIIPWMRVEACYQMALMRFKHCTQQIDETQAFELLQMVSESPDADSDTQLNAIRHIAIMSVQHPYLQSLMGANS